jgi:phosphotransferase system IIB component
MNAILGGGSSGKLYKNIREDKGYTYGAFSSLSNDELIGSFSASASVRNEVTDSAIVEFMKELNSVRNETVTQEELDLAKNAIAGSFARSLESPQTVANFALNTARYNLPDDYYTSYLENLSKVNAEDVKAMAKKYVRPDNARIIVVGNKDEVAEKLARFDAEDEKVTFYDIYANEKKEVDESMSDDMTAESVVKNYLDALGGAEKLKSVTSMTSQLTMDMMGQSINMSIYQQAPNKISMQMSAQGMTVMKQIYDGTQGVMEQMGQKMKIEGDQLNSMAAQAKIFEELNYLDGTYSLELKGMDEVNGEKCYKLIVEDANGVKSTEMYSVESGLKLREIGSQEAGGQKMTITNDYMDYSEVDGILFPQKLKTSGAGPMPFEMKVQSIELNGEIDPAVFVIEN